MTKQRSPAQQIGLLILFVVPFTVAVLGIFLGLIIWLNPRDQPQQVSAEGLLNLMLVVFISTILFLLMHRLFYRQWWMHDRARARGEMPDFRLGRTPLEPPPPVPWPISVKVRHAIMKLVAIAGLIYGFGYYDHQVKLLVVYDWVPLRLPDAAAVVFMIIPGGILLAIFAVALRGQRKRRDRGQLDSEQRLLLLAETNWLTAYALALGGAAFMCALFGFMVIHTLA